jgi:hypothetical protein
MLRISSYGRLLGTRYEFVGSVKVEGVLDRSSDHQLYFVRETEKTASRRLTFKNRASYI